MKTCPQSNPANARIFRRAGFSLVEVMVAAVVVAIVLGALFAGINSTLKLLGFARENLRATQIMVSKLENLRLCTWSNDQLFSGEVVPTVFMDSFYPPGMRSNTNSGVRYQGNISITTNFALNPPVTYSNKLALVTVSVVWNTVDGIRTNTHRRFMNTLIAEDGLQNYLYYH